MRYPPIQCQPVYRMNHSYIPRMVRYVRPVVTINRHIIVNIPRHYYVPVTRNVVVDPGCPYPGRRPMPY